jgi:hypothetical protein
MLLPPATQKQRLWRCDLKKSHATAVPEWLYTKIQGWSVLVGLVPRERWHGETAPQKQSIRPGFENHKNRRLRKIGRVSKLINESSPLPRDVTVKEFVENTYLPFYGKEWKRVTDAARTTSITHHMWELLEHTNSLR